MCDTTILSQRRGDGPKAGTSGASEAARAKPGSRTGDLLLVDVPIQLLDPGDKQTP